MDTRTIPTDATSLAEQKLEALLDTAVDAVIIMSQAGRIEQCNRAAERLFGFDRGELIGQDVTVLMPEPHRQRHAGYVERYLRTREPHIIGTGREVGAQRKDGSVFPMRLSVGELRSVGALRFVGFLHDLTAYKQGIVDLLEARNRAQSYLDLADVMMVALDDSGRISMINRKGCEILGRSESELYGQDWTSLCVPEWQRAAARELLDSLALDDASAPVRYVESEVLRRDGERRVMAWRSRVLHDDGGRVLGVLSSGEDVTERRAVERALERSEAEIQRTRERLTHVSRLSTMGEMASGLAHEINQPLTAISVYAQACARLLANETAMDRDTLRDALDQISAQAIRAGEVIRRLRTMVRQKTVARATLDCKDLVRELIALAEPDMRANDMELHVDLPDEALLVHVDAVQIQQVLLNLIRNAIDATLETPGATRRIDIRVLSNDRDEFELSVADHGCGLPAQVADRLFDPFFTTKASGTGLGLSISRSIVRDHGGRLECAPTPGGGATFTFTLPRAKEE